MMLNNNQQFVLEIAKMGHNLLLMGFGLTVKSHGKCHDKNPA